MAQWQGRPTLRLQQNGTLEAAPRPSGRPLLPSHTHTPPPQLRPDLLLVRS